TSEARALGNAGIYNADSASLRESVAAARDALRLVSQDEDPDRWAKTNAELASSLSTLSDIAGDAAAGREALEVYETLLAVNTREANPQRWAITVNNFVIALQVAGSREQDTATLERSAGLYRQLVDAG